MNTILKAGQVVLPAPVSISTADEIIWSSETGRSVESGKMIGDVIANKKTLEIAWGILDEDDVKLIANNLRSGFYPITFRDDGVEMTITVYRGTLKKEHLGYAGGEYFYKSVSVSIIQQ